MKAEELQNFRLRLEKKIKEKIFKGSAEALNRDVRIFFKNHPTGINVGVTNFKPIEVSGTKTSDTIAIFKKGYPAIMELGHEKAKSGYTYPYGESGKFIYFKDEPKLRTWAKKNLPNYNRKMKGMRVGSPRKTTFGKPVNQWFTTSTMRLKQDPETHKIILNQLRRIKQEIKT